MAFNLRCSESMPHFSRIRMIDEDIPNVPDRGRSPLRKFRSQIRAPYALIKDLSSRDQDIAMSFIKALAAQHKKRSTEKKKLRKKINQMLRRVIVISRELHTLNSHPAEFVRIPDCMMPILDITSQGVEVFCKTRRIS